MIGTQLAGGLHHAQQSLLAAQARYDRSTAAITLLKRDEELRKLRVQDILLKDEIRVLDEQLWDEEDRCADLEWEIDELRARAQDDSDLYDSLRTELVTRTRELDILRVSQQMNWIATMTLTGGPG